MTLRDIDRLLVPCRPVAVNDPTQIGECLTVGCQELGNIRLASRHAFDVY